MLLQVPHCSSVPVERSGTMTAAFASSLHQVNNERRQEQPYCCCWCNGITAQGRWHDWGRRTSMLLFVSLILFAGPSHAWLSTAITAVRIHSLMVVKQPPSLSSCIASINRRRAFPELFMSFGRRDLEEEHADYEDEDDDDDEEPPEVNVQNFHPPTASFGLNRGRSSPSQRKAVGQSASSTARIYLCTNCGAESVKWMGRCPTCLEWNTMQEHAVIRQAPASSSNRLGSISNSMLGGGGGGARSRPVFGRSSARTSSWLDGVGGDGGYGSLDSSLSDGKPVRITDLYDKETSKDGSTSFRTRNKRIVIPQDDELNTVLGGGILPGSLTLLGGDPGVGKSTLLLQAAASVATLSTKLPGIGMGPVVQTRQSGGDDFIPMGPVWYVSGEENPDQIANRALRLGMAESTELFLLGETHADSLCAQVVDHYERSQMLLDNHGKTAPDVEVLAAAAAAVPSLIVIDSIQTMVCDSAGGTAAGGVSQVRECVALFLRLAKSTGIPIMLVGHVTKSGQVAGPRTVEHMVDCVLYLEGAGGSSSTSSSDGGSSSSNGDPLAATNSLRILRASKNRFGSCDEVGVYEMTAGRLLPVSDPSSLFLAQRSNSDDEDAEGCAIAIALEGMRAITIEIQALVVMASGNNGFGRRTVEGIAYSRLMLLMGVLQKRCKIFLGRQDVYINVAGRMRLDRGGEGHAADLAVAVALVSSLTQIPVRADSVFIGEVGLLGELRSVSALDKRIQEARRMGFSRVITPAATRRKGSSKRGAKKNGRTTSQAHGMEWIQCDTLMDAIEVGLCAPLPQPKRKRKTTKESGGTIPEQLGDLGLDEILDDEDEDSFL